MEWWVWLILGAIAYGALIFGIGVTIGKVIRRADLERERQEWTRLADASRAARLREQGRIHDVRPDATGPPAVVRRMTVLGKSPRHKPPTRM